LRVVVHRCLVGSGRAKALIQKRFSWADFAENQIAYEHLPSVTNLYLTGYEKVFRSKEPISDARKHQFKEHRRLRMKNQMKKRSAGVLPAFDHGTQDWQKPGSAKASVKFPGNPALRWAHA
jgi:hypothetical protein